MSYNLVLEKSGQNSVGLIKDLYEVLSSSGFEVHAFRDVEILDPQQEKSKGKELFISRNGKHFSMSASPFDNFFSTTDDIPVDDSLRVHCGVFGVSINTSFISNDLYYNQPTNNPSQSVKNVCGGACIPKNDFFDYQIFSDKKGWQWFIKISFNDVATGDEMNFFVMFGDIFEGENIKEGQYSLGSNTQGVSGMTWNGYTSYYIDPAYETTTDNPYRSTHPLMNYGTEKYNLFYTDINDDLVSHYLINSIVSTEYSLPNRNFGFNEHIYASSHNEFLGITPLFPFEFFVPKFTITEVKSMGKLPMGVVNQWGVENGEIRIINNKKIQFFHVFKRDQNQTPKSHMNKGMAIYIERGL